MFRAASGRRGGGSGSGASTDRHFMSRVETRPVVTSSSIVVWNCVVVCMLLESVANQSINEFEDGAVIHGRDDDSETPKLTLMHSSSCQRYVLLN